MVDPMTPSTNPARDEAVLDQDRVKSWPLLKHALWMVITGEELNDGHYINAYQLTDKLYEAALSAAPAPAGGVDAVAAIIAKWVDEKRFADAPAFRMAAREIIASLSPAATSGSEAGGDDPKEVRDLAWKMWCEDQPGIIWTLDNKRAYREKARAALAKPSSPAGGDVALVDDLVVLSRMIQRSTPCMNAEGRAYKAVISASHVALIERAAAALSPSTSAAEPVAFQQRVQPWMMACFGPEISADVVERNHRFLEEALELVQSTGCTASEAHQLVDYVYGRPVGEAHQEIGGVMVTLAALCLALGEDMHAAGETELARIWTKVEKIRAKQAAKPKHSPLPERPAPAAVESAQEVKEACAQIADARAHEAIESGWNRAKSRTGRDKANAAARMAQTIAADIRASLATEKEA